MSKKLLSLRAFRIPSKNFLLKASFMTTIAGILSIGFVIGSLIVEDGYVDAPDNQASSRMRRLSQLILNDINDPEITVRPIRGTVVLEGYAFDEHERQRAELLAQSYIKGYIPLLPRHVNVLNLIELKEFHKWETVDNR